MAFRNIAIVLAAAMATAGAAQAATLKIGDAAPAWSKLPGVDGRAHSLADYKSSRLVVLVFTCNHCPVASGYEDRLIALQKGFEGKGVRLVAVNVNNLEADRLDAMKQRAKKKQFNFPYLYDATQRIGRQYGATATPHVFVLDQDRKIAYMGAIDDNMDAAKAAKHYLRDAIEALLAGKKPTRATTLQFGCSIKYDDDAPKGAPAGRK